MKISDTIKELHQSGDFGKALEGLAEKAQALEDKTSNDTLASQLASHLYGVSKLRHGLFTPPQFRRDSEYWIRNYLNKGSHEDQRHDKKDDSNTPSQHLSQSQHS